MGWEAKDFYRYISDPEGSAQEYAVCSDLSLRVSSFMERVRKQGASVFAPRTPSKDQIKAKGCRNTRQPFSIPL